MADTQIHPTGVVQAPGDFIIPASAELVLKVVYASFDGSGAATDFLPLLRVISDAGTVVAESASDTTVAAGGSADVTWFPRLAAAAASSGVDVLPVAAGRVDPGTPVTVPAHSAIEIPWVEVNTSDASQFSWSSGSPTLLNVTDGGIVLYSLTVMPWVDWPLAAAGFIRFWGHSGSDDSVETSSLFASYPAVQLYSDQATGPYPVTIHGIPAPIDLAGSKVWQAHIFNSTAAAWQFGDGTHFTVARLSNLVFD